MISEMLSRLRFLFRKRSRQDLDQEFQNHFEQSIAFHLATGMTQAEAKRAAMLDFGSLEAAREQCDDQHPRAAFDILRQDLRYSFRSLRRDRGFALVAVLILALGIGANLIVFSLVNTILLRPLPFRNPSQLAWIAPLQTEGGLSGATYSIDAFDDLRAMNTSFQDLTGYNAFTNSDNLKLTGNGIPRPVTGVEVIGNFFRVLGVTPELGRDFTSGESGPGSPPVALLSHAFWQSQFHGDRTIVGRTIALDNVPVTVVGVLPKSFDFGSAFSPGTKVDLIRPADMEQLRGSGNITTLIGRLKPDVSFAQAAAEFQLLFPRLYWSKKFPDTLGTYKPASPIQLKDHIAGQLRRSLYVLWAAVGFILLIVCVNLSNLLLARASARNREFALRLALGAGRVRLVRQLLTESAVLAAAGAVLGLILAFAGTSWLAHQDSLALPLLSTLHMDQAVLLWTVPIASAACLLFGLAPAIRMGSSNLQTALKDAGPSTSEGRRHERFRTILVVSEVALACVLTVGAGLLLRSFLHVLDVDLGFQPAQASAISLDMNMQDHPTKTQRSTFYRNVLREISMLPGIQGAGISDNLPLSRNRTWGAPGVKGVHYKQNDRPPSFVYIISPGYLSAMGMHLRGRDFTWHDDDDDEKSERVVLLNKSATRFLFPGQNPLNRIVVMGGREVKIVGVVPDVHETEVETTSAWQVYLPITQGWGEDGAQLVVRSTLPTASLAPVVLKKLYDMNPNQPAVELRPMQSFVDHSTSPRRFFAVLVALFASLGLTLACLGIYGVVSYAVTRQTQEIGIRMALGASRHHIQLRVIRNTLRMTLLGITAGAFASLAVARAIRSMLFGTKPADPVTFVAMLVILLGVAITAGYLPALRASRISPLIALRAQ